MFAAASKPRPPLPGGPYLVVGLARSGSAVALALAGRGEAVVGCDSGSPEEARRLVEAGVEVHLDVDGVELLDRVAAVVKSPGVPQDAPAIAAARERGIAVLGELEVGWRLLPNSVVAVTGTNGKTTVTELIGHLYRGAGLPVAVAGNVGTPLASLVGEVDPDATAVCECSSFQLEDSEAFAPECAVFLNLSPDHLDRHASLEDYLAAKLRIFANQDEDDVAVYCRDPTAYGGVGWPGAEGRPVGRERPVSYCRSPTAGRRSSGNRAAAEGGHEATRCDVTLAGGVIHWQGEPLLAADELSLLGEHNVDNAMAAAAAGLAMGLPRDAVGEGLRTFAPVPHRLERVAEIDGVEYVNDSKATNVSAAIAAISSFDGGVRAILGGSLKGESFERLAAPVAERCVACYLIGEAADRLEHDVGPARAEGVAIHRAPDLEAAVGTAAADAVPGNVVLLAPACASFDAYRDFEERGEHFRVLVGRLG